MLFVYLCTGLILASWLYQNSKQNKFQIRRTPLDLPILLFFLSQLLSTILSIDPHTSLWGYYSRFHGGLASTICYIVLFYAFVSNITTLKDLGFIVHSILASTALVVTYAILEHFGIDKNLWIQDVQNRVFSTLGQPNWLSAYLVAVLPIPFYLATRDTLTRTRKRVYLIFFFVTILAILYTKSRSGVTALILELAVLFLIHFRHSTKLVILSTLTILILALSSGTPWTPTPSLIAYRLRVGGPLWVELESKLNHVGLTSQIKPLNLDLLEPQVRKEVEATRRGERIGGSDSMDIRKVVWQGAINLGLTHPIFGTGVETFGYTYYWVRPLAHNQLSEWEFLYNKAHNEYLNFFANSGLIGLTTYLILITTIIVLFIKSLRRGEYHLTEGLLIGFASLLFTNFFGFSVVAVALLFFLYPAFTLVSSSNQNHKFYRLHLSQPIIFQTIAAFILVASALNVSKSFRSDLAYNYGKNLLESGYLADSLKYLEKAVLLNPKEPLFLSNLAEAQAQAALTISSQLKSLPATEAAKLKDRGDRLIADYTLKALDNSSRSIEMNRYQTNYYKSKAKVELTLANLDDKHTQEAINTLQELGKIAPTDPKVPYNLGLVFQSLDQKDLAKKYFRQAIELKNDYYAAINALAGLEKR